MSNKLRTIFIIVIGFIGFMSMCLSQLFHRDSTGHYLCWLSAIIALGWVIVTVIKMDTDKSNP